MTEDIIIVILRYTNYLRIWTQLKLLCFKDKSTGVYSSHGVSTENISLETGGQGLGEKDVAWCYVCVNGPDCLR